MIPNLVTSEGDFLSDLTEPEISITGAVTATIGRMHVCSGTSADYTVTLPAVSGNAGKSIGFRMSGALTKLVTLDGNSAEEIDGATTRVMWANEAAILFCDGVSWTKVGGKSIPMETDAYSVTNQTGLTSSTFNQVIMATEGEDTGDVFTASTITARRANKWDLTVSVAIQAETANLNRFIIAVYKNGTSVERTADLTATFGTSGPYMALSTSVDLSIGDTIKLYVFAQTSSGLWKILNTSATTRHRTGIIAKERVIW